MPDVIASYGMLFDFIAFFGYFKRPFMSEVTDRIPCYESAFSIKVNLCKHLWSRQSSFLIGKLSRNGNIEIVTKVNAMKRLNIVTPFLFK